VSEGLAEVAGSAGLAESHVIAISRAVFKFSLLMQAAELKSAMPFVEAVAALSAVLFERMSDANWEACVTMLGFWERLAKGKSLRHANVLGHVVHGFIKGLSFRRVWSNCAVFGRLRRRMSEDGRSK
jgi:hypothetical protein